MKITDIALCLLLFGGLSASCVREDLSDCYDTGKLVLSYRGDGETEIFGEKICRVEMYVFDAENKCVGSGTLPADQVASRTAVLPPLEPGDYRIICLGNTHSTGVNNLESCRFDQMRFAAGDYWSGGNVAGNDSLYYASASYTVNSYSFSAGRQPQVVEFASAHYKVLAEVVGVSGSGGRSGGIPVLELCNVSPCTDFENRACGEAATYRLATEYDGGNMLLTARANIMRHKNHEDVSLCLLTASGEEKLAEVNFAEFLEAHRDVIDCSRQEVLIPIRIELKSGNVTITVPEWYVEDVKPEF